MNPNEEQSLLFTIVQTWRPNEIPEYRGFRCAHCQQYKNEAWHHWLTIGDYLLPVHLCDDTCEPALKNNELTVDMTKVGIIDRASFGNEYKYSDITSKRFNEIITTWPKAQKPILKVFSCDECGDDLAIDPSDGTRKGYHVWYKMDLPAGRHGDNKTLAELHFHRRCAEKIGITS